MDGPGQFGAKGIRCATDLVPLAKARVEAPGFYIHVHYCPVCSGVLLVGSELQRLTGLQHASQLFPELRAGPTTRGPPCIGCGRFAHVLPRAAATIDGCYHCGSIWIGSAFLERVPGSGGPLAWPRFQQVLGRIGLAFQ